MFKVSPGIEPGLKDSKSLVIPLHHETNKIKKNIFLNNTYATISLFFFVTVAHLKPRGFC